MIRLNNIKWYILIIIVSLITLVLYECLVFGLLLLVGLVIPYEGDTLLHKTLVVIFTAFSIIGFMITPILIPRYLGNKLVKLGKIK